MRLLGESTYGGIRRNTVVLLIVETSCSHQDIHTVDGYGKRSRACNRGVYTRGSSFRVSEKEQDGGVFTNMIMRGICVYILPIC